MAQTYFSWIAPILYRGKVAPNIITRAKLPDSIISNRRLFHPYQIEDGDRPDTIAYFYYGNDFYDWIVLLSNGIIDLRNEWPLTVDELNNHITSKYGSWSQATQTTSHYELSRDADDITTVVYENLPANHKQYYTLANFDSYGIKQDTTRLNQASYDLLDAGERSFWRPVSQYTAEVDANENKRLIFLVDRAYVPDIEESLKKVFDV